MGQELDLTIPMGTFQLGLFYHYMNCSCCIAGNTVVIVVKTKASFQQMAYRPSNGKNVSVLFGILTQMEQVAFPFAMLSYHSVH